MAATTEQSLGWYHNWKETWFHFKLVYSTDQTLINYEIMYSQLARLIKNIYNQN